MRRRVLQYADILLQEESFKALIVTPRDVLRRRFSSILPDDIIAASRKIRFPKRPTLTMDRECSASFPGDADSIGSRTEMSTAANVEGAKLGEEKESGVWIDVSRWFYCLSSLSTRLSVIQEQKGWRPARSESSVQFLAFLLYNYHIICSRSTVW